MVKAIINSGVCGFITTVEATSEDGMEVTLTVESGCPAVSAMFDALGNTFDGYEIVFPQPGTNAFYAYAADNFPPHGGCITIAGITKAIEVACSLALPKEASIIFES